MSAEAKFGVAWLAAFALFLVICVLAANHDTFPGDVRLAQRIQDIDGAAFARALDWAEDAADIAAVAVITVITAVLLRLRRDRLAATVFIVAVCVRVLTTWIAKELIERPRPSGDLVEFSSHPGTFSFPSGHAAAAFVLYGLIFYFATVHIPNAVARAAIQVLCVVITIGAGLERVFVGHHWPSDVLGGYHHGALIVAAAVAVHQLAPRMRLEVTSGRFPRLHVRQPDATETLGHAREP